MKKYFETQNKNFCCEYPSKCPICGNNISPERKGEHYNSDINLVSLLFVCPACGKGFLAHYVDTNQDEIYKGYRYYNLKYIDSFPQKPRKKEFNDFINNISINFDEIYNQAYFSEIYELNQLSGMGYRKSLEFLIKDYCIYKNFDKIEEIKNMPLSQVINTYIDSEKIKNLAKVSVWLGNDETHYVKKFEEKDIEDLKMFIDAMVAFITYELIADEAKDIIDNK